MVDWTKAVESLEQSQPQPVYVLVGTEPLLMRWFVERLCQKAAAPGEVARPLRFSYENGGCEDAVLACQTIGLFGAGDVVVLEHCTALLQGTKVKWDTQPLEAYLEHPLPGRVFVLTAVGEQLDERKRLGKLAKRHTVVDCTTPKERMALQLLGDLARERGVVAQPAALRELWRRAQALSPCEAELEKLAAYANGQPVEVRHVRELVAERPEDNVFHWLDAVVRGDVRRAFATLADVRLAGYDALALLALMARQLRLLWMVRWYGERGETQANIAKRLGVHPYAVKTAAEQAPLWTLRRLEDLLLVVADAEFEVKSGRRDADQVLDWLVMACLAGSRPHSWAT
ncbi:MAG: DNA polymerase III subunit delta [Alicyclobacillaceae bacterium]|nr:DNA polymerase III subunit delta [Alicyclobacillaceae bacterium]